MGWTAWEKVSGCEFDELIYEKKYLDTGGGVARVSVNRPDVMNGFSMNGIQEIGKALNDTSRDPQIGVVVITGVGDHFGTGGDMKWEEKGGLDEVFYYNYPPDQFLRQCRKPIIAAVKGFCIGGSHHMAYNCDFTIAADDAIFGQTGPRIGSCADGYLVANLTRVVGAKKAREMWMLTRQYTAQEALAMGLVNKVVPRDKLDEEVDKWCEEILALNPHSLQVLKATFDIDIEYMVSLYGRISRLMYSNWPEMPEVEEAHKAFFEKRKPNFWQFQKKKRDKGSH